MKVLLFFLGLLVLSASAADAAPECLAGPQWRKAIEARRAMPLSQALRALQPPLPGEIVMARLCEADGELHYALTLVDTQGKVTRASLQASTGHLISKR